MSNNRRHSAKTLMDQFINLLVEWRPGIYISILELSLLYHCGLVKFGLE